MLRIDLSVVPELQGRLGVSAPRRPAGASPAPLMEAPRTEARRTEVPRGATPPTLRGLRALRATLQVLTGVTGTALEPGLAADRGGSEVRCGAEETVSGGLSLTVPT